MLEEGGAEGEKGEESLQAREKASRSRDETLALEIASVVA